MRVLRSGRFRNDVLHAQRFENRAHRTAGDDTGTGRSRPQNHGTGAEVAANVMMNRTTVFQRDTNHRAFGLFRRFANRFGDFARFAGRKSDAAALIADNDQSGKSHTLTAFYGLRHAVDVNKLVNQFVGFAIRTEIRALIIFTFFIAMTAFCIRCTCHFSTFLQNDKPASRAASAKALTRP